MTRTALLPRGRTSAGACLLFGPLLLAAFTPRARGEGPPRPDLGRDPLVPSQVVTPAAGQPAEQPTHRIRLFRIQPAFLGEPPGPDPDERPAPEAEAGPDFVSVAFCNDNPFFDFRRQGDPGGVGYARVNTQVQLFGTETTALALGVQAVAPAGVEYDGLPDRLGTTVLTPALSVFHALDDVTAVQAFVGKNVPIQNSAAQTVRRDVQYGMAVQRPVSTRNDDPLRFLYLSVGALGLLRTEKEARTSAVLEVLPGLHYKVAENWWISGGLSVPVGAPRTEAGQLWQVTCSLQF
jgi:hypothetical protein